MREPIRHGIDPTPPAERTATINRSSGPPTPRRDPAAEPEPAPDLPTGDPDRYHADGEHARGGLGRIIRARDQALGRTVAVKELLHPTGDAEARFVREALITARLQHPGVVPVHEAGRWPTGEPYYVMKLISGRSLKDLIAERGRLEERLALLPNLIAVAETIAYAHSEGVIHRDIKPANVMIGEFGETVVVDWGIATAAGDARRASGPADAAGPAIDKGDLTLNGGILGTPAYMAPEQARGAEVDERADVYALGALLYELLAGKPPYAGEDSDSPTSAPGRGVLERLLAGPPVPVEQLAPGAPVELVAICAAAMARLPEDRYGRAKQVADDLKRFQTGQLVSAHRYSTFTLLRRWTARHKGVVSAAALALVAVTLTGVFAINSVVEQRNLARSESRRADQARAAIEVKHRQLHLVNARSAIERDPTAAIAWLKQYPLDGPELSKVRAMIDAARAAGVARHVFRVGVWAIDAVFSPDGKRLATASQDGSIRLRAIDGGAVVGGFQVPAATRRLAFSPDGRTLAVGDATGAIHEVSIAGPGPAALPAKPRMRAGGGVEDLRYSRDGLHLVATDLDGKLFVWDVGTGRLRLSLAGRVAMSVDGTLVAALTADDQLEIHDLTAGTRVVAPAAALGPVRLLAVGRAGRTIRLAALDTAGVVRLYDPAARTARELGQQPGVLPNLQLSPSGNLLVSMGDDRTIRVWDLTGGGGSELRGHDDNIYHVVFSADERVLISAGDDGTARIWDLATGAARVLRGHTDDVYRVALSPDGRHIATAGLDGTARLWPARADDGRILLGHGDAVGHVVALRGGGAVSQGFDGELRRWDAALEQGRTVCRAPVTRKAPAGAPQTPGRVRVSSDGRWATVEEEHGLWACNLDSGRELHLRGEHDVASSWTYGEDPDALLVSYRDGALLRWNLATGAGTLIDWLPRTAQVTAWARGGGRVAVAGPDAIEIHDLGARLSEPRRIPTGKVRVLGLGFSPDGRWLLGRTGAHAHPLIEVATGELRWLDTGDQFVVHGDFDRAGERLALSVVDRTIRVWQLHGGGPPRVLRGHGDLIHQVEFSPDGRTLASASYDKTVRLWDLASGDSRVLRGHGLSVDSIDFTADGSRLLSGSRDRSVRVWDLRALPPADPRSLQARLDQLTTAAIVDGQPVTPGS